MMDYNNMFSRIQQFGQNPQQLQQRMQGLGQNPGLHLGQQMHPNRGLHLGQGMGNPAQQNPMMQRLQGMGVGMGLQPQQQPQQPTQGMGAGMGRPINRFRG
jgi:hypothetical protein